MCKCVTEWVLRRNTEHYHSHRELFVYAYCPWTCMSTKVSLRLCLACLPFVYTTSFQVPLTAADQGDVPGQGAKETHWEKVWEDRQGDRKTNAPWSESGLEWGRDNWHITRWLLILLSNWQWTPIRKNTILLRVLLSVIHQFVNCKQPMQSFLTEAQNNVRKENFSRPGVSDQERLIRNPWALSQQAQTSFSLSTHC